MQETSALYKSGMKQPLRDRSFIKVSFGLINQEAQAKAVVQNKHDLSYFSNATGLFQQGKDKSVHATFEPDFTKVDGSLLFPPRDNVYGYRKAEYQTSGYVMSERIMSTTEAPSIAVDIGAKPITIKGLTIDFGENYATELGISINYENPVMYQNTSPVFKTEDVFKDVRQIRIFIRRMKEENRRMRVFYIQFGIGLSYDNSSVMDSSLESYISPISADMPQVDFSVTLDNQNRYFDVDNPNSAINFLETGQELEVYYGYEIPTEDRIEWVKGGKLLCSEWESDDHSATIRGQDVFRNLTGEYSKGTVQQSGVKLRQLAEDILRDAGLSVKDAILTYLLDETSTTCPMPRVSHKEGLQIIANACRCVLSQTRDGQISIQPNFEASVKNVSGTSKFFPQRDLTNVLDDSEKQDYAFLANNYTTVDGGMFFYPRNSRIVKNVSFVTNERASIRKNNGYGFPKSQKIELATDRPTTCGSVQVKFGNTPVKELHIITYLNNEVVDEVHQVAANDNGLAQLLVIEHPFQSFNKMVISIETMITKDTVASIQYIGLGESEKFMFDRTDMLNYPKAIKQELVASIIVPYYSFQLEDKEESMINEDVVEKRGNVRSFFFDQPCTGFKVRLNENQTANVRIIGHSHYRVDVEFLADIQGRFEILGRHYKRVEQRVQKTLNNDGKIITWENPLISTREHATKIADWLAEYYKSGIEYEFDTRGNPELDVNDITRQENEFNPDMKVNLYRHTVSFNQALSGKATTRRIGG